MKKPDKYDEDILRQYINPENIEKSPEGLTQKVMARIRYETEPVRNKESLRNRIRIPAISTAITLILIIIALILPESSSTVLPGAAIFQDIKLPEIKISFDSYFNFNMPVLAVYLLVGIILLAIFDKALFRLFHRER